FSEIVEHIEDAMLTAVNRQSHADVPVAALLSGGIDAALIVGALCRSQATKPTTFNVACGDAAYDETALALTVARAYKPQHHTIRIGAPLLAPESVLALLAHCDQPFADTSMFAVYAVSQAIRERGIICTLSGDGGDESFGGYAS